MIRYQQHPQGGVVCTCMNCGQQAHVAHPQAFAQTHSCRHLGLGDMVARATQVVGIKPCTPCEARKRAMNGFFPKVWRR